MTPERAEEILRQGNLDTDFRQYMTEDEIEYILKFWDQIGGSTSFYALLRLIANGQIK